jgi:hypothetical protein
VRCDFTSSRATHAIAHHQHCAALAEVILALVQKICLAAI